MDVVRARRIAAAALVENILMVMVEIFLRMNGCCGD